METIHLKYAPKFRRKPVKNATLRLEVSPSLNEAKGWMLNDRYQYALRFLEEFQKAIQPKTEAPTVFTKLLSVDGKDYSIRMPMEAYKAMDEAIGTPDQSVPCENVLNVAMLQFMYYVDAATAMSESCGGGGGTSSNWGKDKDEDDRDVLLSASEKWARRCAQHAKWLCKSIKRSKGYGR